MTVPEVVFPDIVGHVIGYLSTHALLPTVAGRVSTTLPDNFTPPYVRVQRIGGVLREPVRLDIADLSVHCWSPSNRDADRLAASVRAAMYALPNANSSTVVVTLATEQSAPQLLVDETRPEPLPRVVMTWSVCYRPNP